MLSFRQPGDMGRYIADNDPGQIAAGFSNLEDFLAAGNQIPENRRNPYGTEFIGIGADQTNLFGYKVPDYVIREQEEKMKNNPININVSGVLPGSGSLKPLNPFAGRPVLTGNEERIREGVSQDIFGEPNLLAPLNPVPGAQQATPGTPNTESFSQDVLRDSDGNPLKNFTPIRSPGLPQPTDPAGLQEAIATVDPIVSGDDSIATTQQVPDAGLFNRIGQQLIGYDDQFSGINDRLNKIEEGIASLIQNRGQGLNMNTGGLGYFFNPFGGFYG